MSGFILALAPYDRTRYGTILVIDDNHRVVFSCDAYFKADNKKAAEMGNPDRHPLYPYGDHPCGRYIVQVGPTFGIHPCLLLVPSEDYRLTNGGDAWAATRPTEWKKRRSLYVPPDLGKIPNDGMRLGIACHGGAEGIGDVLRPAYGCVRVHDKDQAKVVDRVNDLKITVWITMEK